MKKKALIITNTSGFLMKFERDNVRILQELGYQVHFASNQYDVVYPYKKEELDNLGVVFHHINIARSPYMLKDNFRAYKDIVRIINEEGVSLVHCHTPTGGLLGRLAVWFCCRKNSNIKVIYTAHGFHFYKGAPLYNQVVFKSVERLLSHITNELIVINSEDYEAAKKMKLKKGGHCYIIPGEGFNISEFTRTGKEDRKKIRSTYGIDPEAMFILSVGELNINKNHITAIKAIKEVIADNEMPKIVYGICGDGFYRKKIETYIKDNGLNDYIRLFGYQESIHDFYAIADFTIFPSIREGLGMAGIESLAMEVPVLAADNRGTREYMADGVNGYVFNPEDTHELADCIRKYLSLSDTEKDIIKGNCKRTVERFDQAYTSSIMEEIYRNID